MSDEHHLNDLSRIGDRGFFERILVEREKLETERFDRIDERFAALDKALKLQADEYARRLHDLNGEYQRDRARQNLYVTVDKWETMNESERVARTAALLRVDEKFEEYVKRYEVRQREIDLMLAAQKGASEAAQKAAEETGRRANRNLALASFGLGIIVFLSNAIPALMGN